MEGKTTQVKVEVEKGEASSPLAAIYGGGHLGLVLKEYLERQGLRVRQVGDASSGLGVWDKPAYIFFFASMTLSAEELGQWFKEALAQAKKGGAKVVLVLDNIDGEREGALEEEQKAAKKRASRLELRGKFSHEWGNLAGLVSKITRLGFSTEEGQKEVAIGRADQYAISKTETERGGVMVSGLGKGMAPSGKRKRRKVRVGVGILIAALGMVLIPLFWIGANTLLGAWQLRLAKELLTAGQFGEAGKTAQVADEAFGRAKGTAAIFSGFLGGKVGGEYVGLLTAGEEAGGVMGKIARVVPKGQELVRALLGGTQAGTGWTEQAKGLVLDLEAIDRELGLVEGEIKTYEGTVPILGKIGYAAELGEARTMLGQGERILSVLPEIFGGGGGRAYLLVFQNSTELRPTGGFIGSYAIAHFDQFGLLDLKINDIYTADGQLRGQVAPPDEILHFLGQPSWFMRDANFAADWPLTARRLEWFLEKETGEKVDGVVAVSLPAVQKLLSATGPLPLPDFNDTVSANDFYKKAEFASEINFFPGSTQKRDYLGAVAGAILGWVTGKGEKDWLEILKEVAAALAEKDIMVYFNNPTVEAAMEENLWAGRITDLGCKGTSSNCLMLVEANFGANKANYFVRRNVLVTTVLDKTGGVLTNVEVRMRNDSPSESWPGGKYKDYLRFLVPSGSELVDFDVGDGRKATVSSVLTAEVIKAVPSNQFLVFSSFEQTADQPVASKSGVASFGTYVELPVGTARTIKFSYRPAYKLDLNKSQQEFDFVFQKQPGTGADPLVWELDYPVFWQATGEKASLAGAQKIIYNVDLSQDRKFQVKFSRD